MVGMKGISQIGWEKGKRGNKMVGMKGISQIGWENIRLAQAFLFVHCLKIQA